MGVEGFVITFGLVATNHAYDNFYCQNLDNQIDWIDFIDLLYYVLGIRGSLHMFNDILGDDILWMITMQGAPSLILVGGIAQSHRLFKFEFQMSRYVSYSCQYFSFV